MGGRVALKQTVENVMKEKAQERIYMLESFGPDASDEEQDEALEKLNEEYKMKQDVAEKAAIEKIESGHVKAQMALRQKQFDEVTDIVKEYGGDTLFKELAASTGRSKEQELQAYREKVEKAKVDRESKIALERESMQAEMKRKMQEEMDQMKAQLEAEELKIKEEMDAQKAEILKKKEEFEKKHEEEE